MLQKQSLRGKWCISQRLSRRTSKLYSLLVHPVTAHVKERFLGLLSCWRIDVLLSILSFHSQPYDSCQAQVCFPPFLRAHKFFRWLNVDIIAQVTELSRAVLAYFLRLKIMLKTCFYKTRLRSHAEICVNILRRKCVSCGTPHVILEKLWHLKAKIVE